MTFTAVLLNTYFNTKLLPIALTLDDIIQNNDIVALGDQNYIRHLNYFGYDADKTEKLYQKLLKYRKTINTNKIDYATSLARSYRW